MGKDAAKLFDLSGKVALITGGSRGLGHEMALAFARAGADVVIASRKADACARAALEVEALGRKALAHACHVGDWSALDGLVDAAYGHFGRVDVLVNNATGGGRPARSLETTPAQWRDALEVNVAAPFELSRAVVPGMQARGRGAIVNVLSTAAFVVVPPMLAYAAMKSALWTMTRYLARECAPAVRVNAVCPGTVQEGGALKVPSWAALLPQTALGRVGEPDEVAAAVLYLACDASSYTTGEVVFVDGGRVLTS